MVSFTKSRMTKGGGYERNMYYEEGKKELLTELCLEKLTARSLLEHKYQTD